MNAEARHRRAIAIAYDGTGAPRVSATGEGKLAEQIEAAARDNDVPMVADAALSGFLAGVPLGDEIPQELYLAVAQVLVFAYGLSGKSPPPNDRDENE
ncbi:MAG: flagellar biosynthesis protein [Gammaproteobacteria bacterium]|jgi:flagellar biosynthesis protein